MHSFDSRVLAGVLAMSVAASTVGCTSKHDSADARLEAIYGAEWKWREEQFPDNEDSQKPIQDHLPKVDPDSQAARLRMWQDTLRKPDPNARDAPPPAL